MKAETEEMRGEKKLREGRMEDQRRLKEREAELAHVPNMQYNSPLSILANMAPPGWTYAFKRRYIADKEDVSNWIAVEEEGWEVVPRSAHPRFFTSKGINTTEAHHNCFFYKGAVLCKIPTSILTARKNVIARTIYEELTSTRAAGLAEKMNESLGLKPGQFTQQTTWDNQMPFT